MTDGAAWTWLGERPAALAAAVVLALLLLRRQPDARVAVWRTLAVVACV